MYYPPLPQVNVKWNFSSYIKHGAYGYATMDICLWICGYATLKRESRGYPCKATFELFVRIFAKYD
jgi:hypothetical protein